MKRRKKQPAKLLPVMETTDDSYIIRRQNRFPKGEVILPHPESFTGRMQNMLIVWEEKHAPKTEQAHSILRTNARVFCEFISTFGKWKMVQEVEEVDDETGESKVVEKPLDPSTVLHDWRKSPDLELMNFMSFLSVHWARYLGEVLDPNDRPAN